MSQPFTDIVVDLAKLRDYCLSDTHPRGKHKARVFRSRLGWTSESAPFLRLLLLDAARNSQNSLVPTIADQFGQRYLLDIEIQAPQGSATVRSTWIALTGQNVLRLTSCYLL